MIAYCTFPYRLYLINQSSKRGRTNEPNRIKKTLNDQSLYSTCRGRIEPIKEAELTGGLQVQIMNIWLLVKRHPKTVVATVTVFFGTFISLILLLLLGESESVKSKHAAKKKNQVNSETIGSTSPSAKNYGLICGTLRDPCELRKKEYERCLDELLGQPEASEVFERLQNLHKSMVKVCPSGQPSLESSVISEFELRLKRMIKKPKDIKSTLEKMSKDFEALKKLFPSYEPIKSLEVQFAQKFGYEFFRSLDRFEKTTDPSKAVKEMKTLNRTLSFGKKLPEIDPTISSHPSLSFTEFLKSDTSSKSKILHPKVRKF